MKTSLIYREYNYLYIIAAILFLGFLFISGCSGGGTIVGNPEPAPTPTSWDELEIYIKSEFSESVLPSDAYAAPDWNVPNAFADVSAATVDDRYSQTNVQEAGVDEADKVKTDGTYLYISGDNAVHIVNAVPADSMSILSTINVNGAIDSLYLHNNVLIVLYTPYEGSGSTWGGTNPDGIAEIGIPYWIPVWAQIGVLMMDVTDPSSPEWIGEWAIDGWMVSSRLTGEKLHIVQQFLPDLPPLQLTYDGTEEGMAEAIAANDLALESVTIDDLIPSYEVFDEQGNPILSARLVMPEDFYRPDEANGGSIVSIVTFNLDDISEGFKSIGLIADAHTVYASTQALYIGSTQWNYGAPVDLNDEYYRTVLYKFALTGEDVIMEGTGDVKGKVLNQFSMGEYNDVLRIATNSGDVWGATIQNNVYCLEVVGDRLEIIGQLEGLAPGEHIYSARFIGTRGFLVTFVKVDPLFTIDLSDPYNPTVAGELKVPGYSDYIHPLGDNHLITIGKDTILEENGMVWYQGLQLSVFDISDFSDPQLLYKELIGDRGTDSEALHNHKAFTFWAENNLLAIPVDLFEHSTEPEYPYFFGEHTFSGLYVYRVTIGEGFEYLGRVGTDSDTWLFSYGNWLRGLFIGEDVYAVNNEAVRSAYIEDIEGSVNTLFLPDGD